MALTSQDEFYDPMGYCSMFTNSNDFDERDITIDPQLLNWRPFSELWYNDAFQLYHLPEPAPATITMEELKDISPRLFPAAIENSTYDDDQDIEDKEEEIEDKEEEIEDEEEEIPRQPRGGKSKRIPPMKQKRKKVPKPKTATTSKRRNGHVAGINRATGERTLVGTYPAIMVDGKFTCPHPNCQTEEHSWTTKNGYKYHLHHVCWRNPKSTKMLRMKAGLPFKASKGKPEFDCECGQSFRSKNGYMSHRHSNESTRDGRCLIKVQKRMAAQRGMAKEEDNGTREPEKMDWSSEVFDVDGRSNQEQLPDTALD